MAYSDLSIIHDANYEFHQLKPLAKWRCRTINNLCLHQLYLQKWRKIRNVKCKMQRLSSRSLKNAYRTVNRGMANQNVAKPFRIACLNFAPN